MKKIVIDGATSFIALHLIEQLVNLDVDIYAIIRKNSLKKEKLNSFPNLKIIELDMDEIEKLPSLISENCDTYYHFAWNGTRGLDRNNYEMQEENFVQSLKTLEVAKQLNCKTFFTAGSQAEYGLQIQKVSEEVICQPLTEYGRAKLKFYEYAKEFGKKNEMRIFEPRFFSIYGPGDYPHTLIMSSIEKMKKNEDVQLSSCKQLWNYFYVEDAAKALIMLDESNIMGGIFNFASHETKPLKEYVLQLKAILNSDSRLFFDDTIPVGMNPDNSKLVHALDRFYESSFEEGIRKTLSLYK